MKCVRTNKHWGFWHVWGKWKTYKAKFHRTITATGERLGEPFFEDWQKRKCIHCGSTQKRPVDGETE